MMSRGLPTFYIAGTPKSGSSALYSLLRSQPDICMSFPKEPSFFLQTPGKNLGQYRDSVFRRWSNEPAVGDACPRHLFFTYAMKAISRATPDAKFIVLCRDPVARIYSHWWDWHTRGMNLDFREWFEQERQWKVADRIPDFKAYNNIRRQSRLLLNTGYAFDCGKYYRNLKKSFKYIDRNQFKIVFFEEFISDPQAITNEIVKFIGLPERAIKVPVRAEQLNLARTLSGSQRPPMSPDDRAVVRAAYAWDTKHLSMMLERELPWADTKKDQPRSLLRTDAMERFEGAAHMEA
jgi:hypothetical protein